MTKPVVAVDIDDVLIETDFQTTEHFAWYSGRSENELSEPEWTLRLQKMHPAILLS